jgi:cytoskeletal protein RodZ
MPITLGKKDKKSRSVAPEAPDGRRPTDQAPALSTSAPAREPLGADLRAKRLEKNVTVSQVVQDTHLSPRHIQNLEEGRYGDLPGGMYNRAILRNYCTYLELDPQAFLDRYELESTPPGERVAKVKPRPAPLPEHTFHIPPIFIWTVMLIGSIAGLYFSRGWIAAVFSPYFAQPPAARIQSPPPAPTSEAGKKAAENAALPPASQETTVPAAIEIEGPPYVAPPAAAAPTPGMIRLEFQATQACWISVNTDAQGSKSMTLQPGDVQSYDARESFVVVLGNAGGVSLKIDGKQAKPLGKPGEVIKIQITPQNIPELLEKVVG